MPAMYQLSTARSEFEPPYTIEVGGKVEHKSVPSYARAISLAQAYVRYNTCRKVEVFDRGRKRVYVPETGTVP
jgi:hypothetical protein